ncbi:MAG TPA: hypothetical protein VJX30_13190 [Terriglobales bacterium]|jgi:hypothetical protein|nr:hypothetical protein [Terriglobales bacterium]
MRKAVVICHNLLHVRTLPTVAEKADRGRGTIGSTVLAFVAYSHEAHSGVFGNQ